jgi:NAD(P)-dependent dehydrogenase (short-subunit alcohol dehydrogenase family)
MLQELLPGIRQFDLTGKSAIITGGSKGLGFAMAAGLASAGADVMLVNRTAAEGEKSAAELRQAFGKDAVSYPADITNIVPGSISAGRSISWPMRILPKSWR